MKDLLKSDKLIKFAFISGIVAIALIFLSDFGKAQKPLLQMSRRWNSV